MKTVAIFDPRPDECEGRKTDLVSELREAAARGEFQPNGWQLLRASVRTSFLGGLRDLARPGHPIVTLVDLRADEAGMQDSGWALIDAIRSYPRLSLVCRNALWTVHASAESSAYARDEAGADAIIEYALYSRRPFPAPGAAAILDQLAGQPPIQGGEFHSWLGKEGTHHEGSHFEQLFEERFGIRALRLDLEILILHSLGFADGAIGRHLDKTKVDERLRKLRGELHGQFAIEEGEFPRIVAQLLSDAQVTDRRLPHDPAPVTPQLFDAWQKREVRVDALLNVAECEVLERYLDPEDTALREQVLNAMLAQHYAPQAAPWSAAHAASGARLADTKPRHGTMAELHDQLKLHAVSGRPSASRHLLDLARGLDKLSATMDDYNRLGRRPEPARPTPVVDLIRECE